MSNAEQHSFPSNIQIHNYDVSVLFIQTRGWINLLYTKVATNNKSGAVTTYATCINFLKQLYDTVKYNIRKLDNVPDWNKKEKLYDEYFERLMKGVYNPTELIKIWDNLRDDIEASGIYSEGENEKIKLITRLLVGGVN
jgi:hypothetical protein